MKPSSAVHNWIVWCWRGLQGRLAVLGFARWRKNNAAQRKKRPFCDPLEGHYNSCSIFCLSSSSIYKKEKRFGSMLEKLKQTIFVEHIRAHCMFMTCFGGLALKFWVKRTSSYVRHRRTVVFFPLFCLTQQNHFWPFEPPYLRNPLFDFKIFLHGLSLAIYLKDSQVWLNSGEKIFSTFFSSGFFCAWDNFLSKIPLCNVVLAIGQE